MKSSVKAAKGFTLIELLIVIGIIAVLATIVVLTLNPAELLRQARDSTRLSDMATLKSALALYLADVTAGYTIGDGANCYMSVAVGIATAGCDPDGVGALLARFTAGTAQGSVSTLNDGNGWLPVNFRLISSGAPIANLPTDPTNVLANDLFYAYRPGGPNGGTCTTLLTCIEYEINVNMESTKFGNPTAGNVESDDGGSSVGLFEVGTTAGLAL